MSPRPLPFTRFLPEVLQVIPTPGQRVLSVVAFDGAQPGELEGEERDLASEIFGDVDTIPEGARHVIAAVCGARGGRLGTMNQRNGVRVKSRGRWSWLTAPSRRAT